MNTEDIAQYPSTSLEIPPIDTLPRHVAVIMDGNGRWANRHGLPRIAGHRRGVDSVRLLVRRCGELGIPYLTLFAFSTENWRRPATEVRLLMELLAATLENEVRKLHESGVRLRVVGERARLNRRIQSLIADAEVLTAANTRLNLTIAVNYGGRWDIVEACRQLAEQAKRGDIEPSDIDIEAIERHLSTRFLPEPDLFIRTGGEQRISNFLLWQLAYTELYFTEVLWPEFGPEAFDEALVSFANRQRRFGQTGDQVAARSRPHAQNG